MKVQPYIAPKKIFSLSVRAKKSKLTSMVLCSTCFSIGWDQQLNCLVDYMGLPLSGSDAVYLIERASQHIQHSPAELADFKRQRMQERYPKMGTEAISSKGME